MSIKVQYRVMYNRADKLNSKGLAPVVIEAYQNPNRRYFSTGFKLKPEDWDTKKNQVRGNAKYNAAIAKQKSDLILSFAFHPFMAGRLSWMTLTY